MKTLVVGGGGREHAIVWGLARSASVEEVHAAPGNAGIARSATCHRVAAEDVGEIVELISGLRPDLVVIGPERPLVAGLADRVRERGVPVFGPGADAARLEGSKAWAKQVMARGSIPTARSATFDRVAPAAAFVDALGGRAVVKADGLAAGKGVTVALDRSSAVRALGACLDDRRFGEAGASVVVEEVLEGPEVSAFALVDAHSVVPLALSQDHKRIGDGDAGPNTGGMGAYSPVPFVGEDVEGAIWDIVRRSVETLRADGIAYSGLLYAGLMLTPDGPKVLEYNCRFGDPETQVVLPRLVGDLAEVLMACATDRLDDVKVVTAGEATVGVVLASAGYPGSYRVGLPIEGIGDAEAVPGVSVFHAGTERADGRVVTAGGRVVCVTACAGSLADARARAYEAADRIAFDGKTMRTDVGGMSA